MKKILFGLAAVLFIMPAVVLAADFKVDEANGNVEVASGEQVKNLYTAGANVTSDANVLGDLVTAGGYIAINGKVQQTLMAAGGNVAVSANIGQNARLAGGNIQFTGTTGQDLLVGAGTLDIGKTANIGGDLMASSGMATINGKVLGDAWMAGGNITINGRIEGNVDIRGAQEVVLGENAYIGGKLKYEAPQQAAISQGAQVVGGTEYSPTKVGDLKVLAGLMAFATVAKWLGVISAFILALLVAYLLNKFAKFTVQKAFNNPWPLFGWGLLVLIVAPVALVILLASVLGMSVAALLGVVLGAVLVFAKPFGALILGAWIVRLFSKDKALRVDWLTALVGVLVAAVLSIIPIVGWIIPFFTYIVALGVMFQWTWDWAKRNK